MHPSAVFIKKNGTLLHAPQFPYVNSKSGLKERTNRFKSVKRLFNGK
jgi:hypothetical protein